jgi:hypothetical protein
MIHQVRVLPEEGQYVRTKCGRMTNDLGTVALDKGDIPEGETLCRGACWRQSLSDKAKVALLGDLVRSATGENIPAADIMAILEDRYYPTDRTESPKAA